MRRAQGSAVIAVLVSAHRSKIWYQKYRRSNRERSQASGDI
jgi:hypothetical protein